ncbi:MAG: translation initiation factor IF-3 [Elusimicrobia bacterium RIFOXYA2_FULL_50_26]|nr:MAG: translation initiation factor IF-3 [Elusimicrobia bacterium RIFOXYA2_FULL_50_26]
MRINYQIRVPQVRLIDEDGTQVGIKQTTDAMRLAQERGRDLVEIAPQASPPVCKILDFSKFRYEEDKKAKDARKKQKGGQLKEVRVRPRISEHDLEIKLKHAREFLSEQNKVQVTIVFMGREMQHRDLGRALGEKIKTMLVENGDLEHNPSMMGNRLILTFVPKK